MSCGHTDSQIQPQMLRPELALEWQLPTPLGWLAWLVHQQRRWRIRAELHGLNDAQLRDVGLTRAQIESALARPFWQP
ncbi:DUF1127 domain-containing protein [Ferrovibrio terrae]|uniref:DUF1127 domain-containing protein n=1 Tax=Ferrovibrio terrae TaxID=2594003 RepID=UPI0031381F39